MKRALPFAAVLAFFFLTCVSALAQNFQPFRKGLTYHFTAQDSIYSLRVDSVKVANGDSVFFFNPTVKPVNFQSSSGCGVNFTVRAKVRQNNQFGQKVIKKPDGVFIFRTENGQEFTLKSKVGTGQNWQFSSDPLLTASLTTKNLELIYNISDSVYTYALSNGEVIKLSKNFGFIKSPNFASYADSSFTPKSLNLYAIPEKNLGTSIHDILKVYDFQPGDEFGYHNTASRPGYNCYDQWSLIKIITRKPIPNGVSYTVNTTIHRLGYGSNQTPDPTCMGMNIPRTYTHNNQTISYTHQPGTDVELLTNGFYVSSAPRTYGNNTAYNTGTYSTGTYINSDYNQRVQMEVENFGFCPAINSFVGQPDAKERYSYATGLGKVKESGLISFYNYVETLVYYKKGTEIYGDRAAFMQLLGSKKERVISQIKTYPNPFTTEVTLKLSELTASGKSKISILNTLGQVVYQTEAAVGTREITLNLPQVAKGVYVVQVTQGSKIYTSQLVKG